MARMARMNADEYFSHPRKSALSAVKNLLVKTRKETIAYKADKKQKRLPAPCMLPPRPTPSQVARFLWKRDGKTPLAWFLTN